MVVEDADEKDNRFFLHVKNNIGPQSKGLSFRLVQSTLDGGVQTSKIAWGTEYISNSADNALAAAEGHVGNDSGRSDAIKFLKAVLADSPTPVLEVERQAIEAGLLHTGQTLAQSKPFRAARKALGIESKKGTGVGGGWVLELPTASKMPLDENYFQPLGTVAAIEVVS
jgi:hypothetical protein